ncbi:MAG TPA: hypothetical protein VFP36_14210, partial [Usitatibacter sp.]|nr:hypothetical protein [Usitatibacter sp.]
MSIATLHRPKAIAAAVATVALAAAAYGVSGLHHSVASEKPASATPPAVPVTVATVEKRQVTPYDEFSGRLEAV